MVVWVEGVGGGWVVGWLVGWLIGWLVGWLAGWLFVGGLAVGWLVRGVQRCPPNVPSGGPSCRPHAARSSTDVGS